MKWPEVPLSQITQRFLSGGTPSTKIPEYWAGDIPWVTGADIIDGEVILGRRYISETALNNSATNVVPKGSLLMVTRTGVGKIALAPVDIAISQDFTGIVLKEGVDPKYASAAIRSRMSVLLARQRGATIKGVTRADVESLSIPLPPLSEQRRIVEILDQADALRKKRAEADAKAARILPALFYKMFGDPATNPKGWPIKRLGDIASVRGGKRLPKGEDYSPIPTPFRYIRGIDITPNIINEDNLQYLYPHIQKSIARYTVSEGDVVITIAGKIGVCAPVMKNLHGVNLTENAAKLAPKGRDTFDARFLSALLNLSYVQKQIDALAGRVTIGKLALFRIEQVIVILPPIELQRKFAVAVEQLAQVSKRQIASCTHFELVFDNLLHRAFTGDLTAKWREAHIKELLAEMEAQAKALESPTPEESASGVRPKRHAGHDMYNKAALAAYITQKCHKPDRPIGRVKLAKLFYLVQCKMCIAFCCQDMV